VAGIDDFLDAVPIGLEGELPAARLELDLVGLAEAAELLGIGRSALWERRRHVSFPLPVAELRCGPVWFRGQIEHYRLSESRLGPRGWHGRRRRANTLER
jgi:hypothetical protein